MFGSYVHKSFNFYCFYVNICTCQNAFVGYKSTLAVDMKVDGALWKAEQKSIQFRIYYNQENMPMSIEYSGWE